MDNVVRSVNIWETKWNDNFIFLQNYEELIRYMKENKDFSFNLCDTYVPGNSERTIYDSIANKNNIYLTYTDEMHPITIINTSFSKKILISPVFFNQHKDQLKTFIKKHIVEKLDEKPFSVYIPDFIVDDELLNNIISNGDLREVNINIVECVGVYLTEEQLQKLSGSHLEVFLKGEKISSKYAIKIYTWSDLETVENLLLKDDLNAKELENFTYINDKCVIKISAINKIDERKYVENLVRIFNILKSHNRSYNIKIEINNRELLMQSGLLNFSNINLIINNDLYDYKKEELLSEEEKLEELVKPIKEANLSPYEKY